MKLAQLSVKDKGLFDEFLNLNIHELSVYSFQNIYIWKGLFDIRWAIIKNSLCVFFRDKMGCFLYLAPLAEKTTVDIIEKVFVIMDSQNSNREVSRVENIEKKDLSFYLKSGYECKKKSCDYICSRTDLVLLEGDKFKAKRASYNYFVKHNEFEYLPFSLSYNDECLGLYELWMLQRRTKSSDYLYRGMLDDNFDCLRIMLDDYRVLGLTGRVVKIGGEIKAFTFGFRLNKDAFCILYEITDLSIKGLAQFIFRRFCSELKDYRQINIMDDSGLENLKKVKLSYRPIKLVPAYIATRKD